jgi:hypothetical protein
LQRKAKSAERKVRKEVREVGRALWHGECQRGAKRLVRPRSRTRSRTSRRTRALARTSSRGGDSGDPGGDSEPHPAAPPLGGGAFSALENRALPGFCQCSPDGKFLTGTQRCWHCGRKPDPASFDSFELAHPGLDAPAKLQLLHADEGGAEAAYADLARRIEAERDVGSVA